MTDVVVRAVGAATTDDPAIVAAAGLLRRGEVVAFPTETVYGLGADALNPAAIERIYLAKGRPSHNPLIVHVADLAAAQALTAQWPSTATQLAERYWPGPLTIVLPKHPSVPDSVTAGLTSVALRIPSHPIALALMRASGRPLAAPSANRSEGVSPTTAEHVRTSLGDRIPLILDGGPTTVGIESTVLDLTAARPRLLRPGMLSQADLEAVIGPIDLVRSADDDAARPAPGMLDRHYATRARLVLVGSNDGDAVRQLVGSARTRGETIGAVLIDGHRVGSVDQSITLPGDPTEYARGLYAALHTLDAAGVGLILLQQPPGSAAWDGIRDRLRRAAHP